MPYTISNIPEDIENALRQKAANEGRRLSEVSLDALRRGVAAGERTPAKRRDLQDIVGSWVADPETDQALADQRWWILRPGEAGIHLWAPSRLPSDYLSTRP